MGLLRKIVLEGDETSCFLFNKLSQVKVESNVCQRPIIISSRGTSKLKAHLEKYPSYLKQFEGVVKAEGARKESMRTNLGQFCRQNDLRWVQIVSRYVMEKSNRLEVFILPLVDNDVPLGLATEEAIMQSFARMYSSGKHKDSETDKKNNKVAFVAASGSVVSDRTTDVASDEEEGDEAGGGASSCSSNENVINAEEEDDEAEDISTLPDNFSDIDVVPISANVSGRGSPLSISGERNSGRDTPFSGAAEQNDPLGAGSSFSTAPGVAIPVENRRNLPTLPITVRKQNHEGLEEKFGKFGLPPAEPSKYRDETYSLVSDSWSTDVVASDNEGLRWF